MGAHAHDPWSTLAVPNVSTLQGKRPSSRRAWRTAAILPFLLILVGSATNATAQSEGELRLEDPAGDVRVTGDPPAPSSSVSEHQDLDLREIWIGDETPVNVTLGLRVEDWQPESRTSRRVLSAPTYAFYLEVNGMAFRLSYWDYAPCEGNGVDFETRAVADTEWAYVTCIPATKDAEAGTLTVDLPKALLLDAEGNPPRIDDPVGKYRVDSTEPFFSVLRSDVAPDGENDAVFVFRLGQSGASPLQLSASPRFRFSNGESTTMLFPVTIENRDSKVHNVALNVHDAPSDWKISIPTSQRVAATETKTIPVIVAIPFRHVHGDVETFVVEAFTIEDEKLTSAVTMGVNFPLVAQPAGHHDHLFLHSSPLDYTNFYDSTYNVRETWLNTVDEDPDPGADDRFAGQGAAATDADGSTFVWQFPLRPSLRIGLDFDPTRTGQFETRLESTAPHSDGTLEGKLLYCDPDDTSGEAASLHGCPRGSWFLLASGDAPIGSITGSAPKDFAMDLAVTPYADLISHRDGANLRLQVTASLPSGAAEQLGMMLHVNESALRLPLFEYHDPIDAVFEDVGELTLRPLDKESQREGNPGRTVAFRFDLRNGGAERATVELDVLGINKEWARWNEAGPIRLAPEETKQLVLLVEIPADASAGERAELFAVARSVDEDAAAVSRIRVTVNDGTDIPDQRADVDAEGSQPALGTLASVAVMVAALVAARRRI